MKILTIFFTAVFICVVSWLSAQSLSLSVSDKIIGSEDELQATYSFKNITNLDELPVQFKDWNIVWKNKTTQYVISNGQQTGGINFNFVLQPKHAGTLTVPGLSVSINGKQLSCSSAQVNVSSKAHVASANKSDDDESDDASSVQQQLQQMQQMQQQMQQQMATIFGNMDDDVPPSQSNNNIVVIRNGESLQSAAKQRMFIKVIPSKTTFYIGEPISVNYVLYSSVGFNPQPVRIPTFSSFSVTDVSQQPALTSTQLNGKTYYTLPIRRAQLEALKTGDLILDSAVINCQFYYVDATDPRGAHLGVATIKSDPIVVHVLPLPTKNKPPNFTGGIGKFTMTASVDKNELPAQENNNLRIQITGTGSLNGVSIPEINWASNIQAYDSKDSQTLDKSSLPMTVTKSFDIPFIGNDSGVAVIPSIHFTYFDTQKNDYVTISTDSIKIAFSKAIASTENTSNSFVKDSGNKKYLWIIGGIALLLLIVFIASEINTKKKKTKKISITENKELNHATIDDNTNLQVHTNAESNIHEQKERLKESFTELENETDNHQFFILAKAWLVQYLHDKLNSISADDNELLSELNAKYPNEFESINNLFMRCNKALYMPAVSGFERDEILKRIRMLVH